MSGQAETQVTAVLLQKRVSLHSSLGPSLQGGRAEGWISASHDMAMPALPQAAGT